jgi:hypothetical protein
MAGVCCAIAAARNGAQVVLMQDRPVYGGNASSEHRMHILGADADENRDTDARETGIIEEIKLEDAVKNPQRSHHVFDLILKEWVDREENIRAFLNTSVVGAETRDGRIVKAYATRPLTEEDFEIEATLYVDCTGDGRLGAEAGADYVIGRESKAEYGESLAIDEPDNHVLGSSILFMTRKHDREMPFIPPKWARKFPRCEDLPPHDDFEFGYWWVEWGGHLNTIKDNDKIRDELLAIALGVWDHIKNQKDHGAANWALDWIETIPSKRESRRFVGDYVLRQQDIVEGRIFRDAVTYGGHRIDIHPPMGIDAVGDPPCWQYPQDPFHTVPLRALYSHNIANLMFAGRNISATHVAFGSIRCMAAAAAIGQSVGVAAAQMIREGIDPRTLAHDDAAIFRLQQQLLRDDCYIQGLRNQDEADVARKAKAVIASSHTLKGQPSNVINGIARNEYDTCNMWESEPGKDLPQWIELQFSEPQVVREIHLTFDTGLRRPLTLTYYKPLLKKMIRGPQPETVADYDIELRLASGETKTVASVEGNYFRKNVHTFESENILAIRVNVKRTNGSDTARVFEVRAY